MGALSGCFYFGIHTVVEGVVENMTDIIGKKLLPCITVPSTLKAAQELIPSLSPFFLLLLPKWSVFLVQGLVFFLDLWTRIFSYGCFFWKKKASAQSAVSSSALAFLTVTSLLDIDLDSSSPIEIQCEVCIHKMPTSNPYASRA